MTQHLTPCLSGGKISQYPYNPTHKQTNSNNSIYISNLKLKFKQKSQALTKSIGMIYPKFLIKP